MSQLVSAGSVLGGRYQLESKIGEGGMGEVWQAVHLTLGSHVAIKALHPFLIRHEGTRARFLNEARVMAQLATRRVVRVFDFGITDGGVPFLVMELVDGETLTRRRTRQGRLSTGTTARLLGQTARGLERAHALGIVHRDLKPDNILLTLDEDGDVQVKVTDFGVATLLDSARGSSTRIEAAKPSTGLFGTPVYMAPEQINSSDATTACDVWAFGVVAYECLTGQLPFLANDMASLRQAIAARSHVPATRLVASIPKAFDDWFDRACATRPEDRYPTIRTAAIALALSLEIEDDNLDRSLAIGATRARSSMRIPAAPISGESPRSLTPPQGNTVIPPRQTSPLLARGLFAVGVASLALSIGVTFRARWAVERNASAQAPAAFSALPISSASASFEATPAPSSTAAPRRGTQEHCVDPVVSEARHDAGDNTARPARAEPRPRSATTTRVSLPQYRDFPDQKPEPPAPTDPSFKEDPYSRGSRLPFGAWQHHLSSRSSRPQPRPNRRSIRSRASIEIASSSLVLPLKFTSEHRRGRSRAGAESFIPATLPSAPSSTRGLPPMRDTRSSGRWVSSGPYYAPLRDEDWRTYAEQLPDGFRCVMKAWSGITTRVDHRTLEPNPNFLDAGLFEDRVLAPIARSFFDHIGPIVLEFPPIPPAALPSPARFIDELDRFLTQLPREFSYAVELRNRELLTPTYLSVLRHHRVGHVLNLWERMPTIGEQMALPGVLTASFVVCRLMIRPGARYAQKKAEYAPFDRIVERDDVTRGDVAALANLCVRDARSLFVIVNNKVEGSSPLTVRGIVERIVGA